MDKLLNLFKVLSDETRIRILILLYHKKLCVCQMQGILEESQPKISKHLGKLRDKGFVKDERQEQFIFYYLDNENEMLKATLESIVANTENYLTLKSDLERLEESDKYIDQLKRREDNI